jgi:hypothetical protein
MTWAIGRINYCPAALGNKKADFIHFLNSSKLSIVAAKIVQVMSPYTSNASDSQTVLHPLCVRRRQGKGCVIGFPFFAAAEVL